VTRGLVLLACMFTLTACAASTEPRIQLGSSEFHLSLSVGAVNFLFWLLLAIIFYLAVRLIQKRNAVISAQRFATWLAAVPSASDPDLPELQKYSRDANWASLPNDDFATLRDTIEKDTAITAADKIRRAAMLGRFFSQWRSSGQENGQALTQILGAIRENGSGIFLSLFALAVFITLAVGMANSSFFSSLAQVDQARGLITFLVAIAAVSVILLTAVNIFWSNSNVPEFNAKFTAAKDLVTIVTGILGTILGFYFGSFNGERLFTLTVDLPVAYSQVTAGAEFEVRASVKGGATPYHFDILIVDASGMPVSRPFDNKQTDGPISEKITVPADKAGKHSIVLLLRDAKGLQARGSVDVLVKPPENQNKTDGAQAPAQQKPASPPQPSASPTPNPDPSPRPSASPTPNPAPSPQPSASPTPNPVPSPNQ
jgi:hypothetical protein